MLNLEPRWVWKTFGHFCFDIPCCYTLFNWDARDSSHLIIICLINSTLVVKILFVNSVFTRPIQVVLWLKKRLGNTFIIKHYNRIRVVTPISCWWMINFIETINCILASIDQPTDSFFIKQTVCKSRILVWQTHSHILRPHCSNIWFLKSSAFTLC